MTQEELDNLGRERKPRNTTDRRPTMSELKAYRFVLATESSNLGGVVYTSKYVYAQDDVDKLLAKKDKEIAKLKDKCQMHDFFWEGCGFDKLGFKNSIAVREAFDRLEADKKLTDAILDERNAEIVELKKACNDKDDWCLHTLKENRHQKHKRCLAMAEWCEVTAMWCYQAANTLPIGFRATLYGKPVMIEPSRLFKRSARLNNWVNRWLELAVEPTWAKFLQLIHKEGK